MILCNGKFMRFVSFPISYMSKLFKSFLSACIYFQWVNKSLTMPPSLVNMLYSSKNLFISLDENKLERFTFNK